MKLAEKYISSNEAKAIGEEKIIISNDAYAICEFIQDLIKTIRNKK